MNWSNELTDLLDLLPSVMKEPRFKDEKSISAEIAEANLDDEILIEQESDSTEVAEESNSSA